MHQSTIPFLSQTIWARGASRQFLSLPRVQTLVPVTFAYSLSSEAVVMRQLRRWKRLWRRYIWFVWIGCYGLSTIVVYYAKSSLYIYQIHMICKYKSEIIFFNGTELICLHASKWFQLLLYNSHNLTSVIYLQILFICNFIFKWVWTNWFAHLYCYCFCTVKWFRLLVFNTRSSIWYQSFVCTQWSGYKHCYLTLIIIFNTIHSFSQRQIVPNIVMLYQYFNLGT